jgi:hypothetical protein
MLWEECTIQQQERERITKLGYVLRVLTRVYNTQDIGVLEFVHRLVL